MLLMISADRKSQVSDIIDTTEDLCGLKVIVSDIPDATEDFCGQKVSFHFQTLLMRLMISLDRQS